MTVTIFYCQFLTESNVFKNHIYNIAVHTSICSEIFISIQLYSKVIFIFFFFNYAKACFNTRLRCVFILIVSQRSSTQCFGAALQNNLLLDLCSLHISIKVNFSPFHAVLLVLMLLIMYVTLHCSLTFYFRILSIRVFSSLDLNKFRSSPVIYFVRVVSIRNSYPYVLKLVNSL